MSVEHSTGMVPSLSQPQQCSKSNFRVTSLVALGSLFEKRTRMADQNLTSPSVAKRGRRFTPTVRGRGRPTRPATPDEGSPAPSQTPETPTEQAATSSSSKSIGHIRPDSNNEGRLPSVHEGQRTRGGAIKVGPWCISSLDLKDRALNAIDLHVAEIQANYTNKTKQERSVRYLVERLVTLYGFL